MENNISEDNAAMDLIIKPDKNKLSIAKIKQKKQQQKKQETFIQSSFKFNSVNPSQIKLLKNIDTKKSHRCR